MIYRVKADGSIETDNLKDALALSQFLSGQKIQLDKLPAQPKEYPNVMAGQKWQNKLTDRIIQVMGIENGFVVPRVLLSKSSRNVARKISLQSLQNNFQLLGVVEEEVPIFVPVTKIKQQIKKSEKKQLALRFPGFPEQSSVHPGQVYEKRYGSSKGKQIKIVFVDGSQVTSKPVKKAHGLKRMQNKKISTLHLKKNWRLVEK